MPFENEIDLFPQQILGRMPLEKIVITVRRQHRTKTLLLFCLENTLQNSETKDTVFNDSGRNFNLILNFFLIWNFKFGKERVLGRFFCMP